MAATAEETPPIACSLDAGEARAQLGEWESALRAAVVSTQRDDSTELRMQLDPASDIGRIVALAQREVACCPFFRFAVEIDTRGLRLIVSAPPDAAAILDALQTLATP
jgi:hypothetical protein